MKRCAVDHRATLPDLRYHLRGPMRSLLALGALVASFSAYADGLRLFNPNDTAVGTSVFCDGAAFTRMLTPHTLDDVDGRGCKATSAAPLLVLETGTFDDGVEWQRKLVTPSGSEGPGWLGGSMIAPPARPGPSLPLGVTECPSTI